ncbi:MAG: SDR family NAD(P)-dependent oxidoreductase, partial [Poseidonia sp.]
MGELNGQTYIVTGASKGIGRSISLELANHGAQVILLSRASTELDQTLADVQSSAPSSFAVACDLGAASSIDAALRH